MTALVMVMGGTPTHIDVVTCTILKVTGVGNDDNVGNTASSGESAIHLCFP